MPSGAIQVMVNGNRDWGGGGWGGGCEIVMYDGHIHKRDAFTKISMHLRG
jgi:hypothetical protein